MRNATTAVMTLLTYHNCHVGILQTIVQTQQPRKDPQMCLPQTGCTSTQSLGPTIGHVCYSTCPENLHASEDWSWPRWQKHFAAEGTKAYSKTIRTGWCAGRNGKNAWNQVAHILYGLSICEVCPYVIICVFLILRRRQCQKRIP